MCPPLCLWWDRKRDSAWGAVLRSTSKEPCHTEQLPVPPLHWAVAVIKRPPWGGCVYPPFWRNVVDLWLGWAVVVSAQGKAAGGMRRPELGRVTWALLRGWVAGEAWCTGKSPQLLAFAAHLHSWKALKYQGNQSSAFSPCLTV